MHAHNEMRREPEFFAHGLRLSLARHVVALARCVCCLSLRVRPITRNPSCPEARPAAAAGLLPAYCLRGSPAADAPARRGMAPDGAGSLGHALAGRAP